MKAGMLFSQEDAEKYESLGCWEQLSLGEYTAKLWEAYTRAATSASQGTA